MKELKRGKKTLFVITVILIWSFPVLFLYLNNVGEVRIHETLLPLGIFLAGGVICSVILSIFLRSLERGELCSILLCLFISNYTYIEKIIRSFIRGARYWHIVPCFLLILAIVFYILGKIKIEMINDILLVFTIVIAGLFFINIISALPVLVKSISEISSREDRDISEIITQDETKEKYNIYYFIFDEYSAFDVLEKYYDYDNYPFADFLEKNHFTVSYNGVNDSQQSQTVISNYVNLEYVSFDSDTGKSRNDKMRSGKLFDIVRKMGYTVDSPNGGGMFGLDSTEAQISTTISGENFSDLIFRNTIFYPLIQENAYQKGKEINKVFDIFKSQDFYETYSEGTFHMIYFELPHQPFVFDANGNDVPLEHINDWINKEYYLGQLIYTTKCIEDTVENILRYDDKSIIILQSDHGARGLQDDKGNYLIDKYDRRHFLNAVYFLGEPIEDIKGKSGVNTLRLVFNKLFDLNLPQLEVPDSDQF